MIAFSCPKCQMRFQVKPQFAGRATKCPTCKQTLVVPAPSQTEAYVPADKIDGTQSSLDQAGVDGGVSLDEQRAGSVSDRSSQKTVRELLAQRPKNGGRYVIAGEIARGGMGAVLRAVDCDIRREVAVKFMLDDRDPKKKMRFIEEAQITGQLAHPNIVPIYELGVDSQKRPFFSMKKVEGRSLKDVLDQLRDNPKQAEKGWTLARLLNVMVSVCNGLAFAHSRGVIHRDLKPANIMVGDFGEVYIMDFGLAKVLGKEEAAPAAGPAATVASVSVKRSSKVETSRQEEADLTQEGAILGTPVYMPPEQATGKPHEIDQRSDVYSLGAILYEMLTLQPPVAKDGGYLAIILQVIQGEIVPPEQRTPDRAKKGKIPRELSAIAMKAQAKNPKDRYPNVEALRRDIERFQEGRSVSAKEDSFREAAWKLVKRNKVASAFTLIVVVLVLWGSWINWQARREADRALDQVKQAVPAIVKAGQFAAEQRRFDDALVQVDLALAHDEKNADARLLKAQLLLVRQDFGAARDQLERCLSDRPEDKTARRFLPLCEGARRDDVDRLLLIAAIFNEHRDYALVDGLLAKYGKNSNEARQFILKMYQERLEQTWKGKAKDLSIDSSGLRLSLEGFKELTDLSPLKGMPLTRLDLSGCVQVRDLTPLQGMPLTTLSFHGCVEVRDLWPLQGMPLTRLGFSGCRVRDLTPLQGMQLTSLSLGSLTYHGCHDVRDLTPLQGMPLTSLSLAFCRSVHDLTPLRGMPLTSLNLDNCFAVRDLSPLQGMPLTSLILESCPADRGPLRSIKSLPRIDNKPVEQFWAEYDAKQKGKN